MREYIRLQTSILLRRLAYQANRAARDSGADAVHDLRVSIRRLSRCLRTFSRFYPDRSAKRVRRRLREMMAFAGAVRDRDIAAGLLHGAGVPARSPAYPQLLQERESAAGRLAAELTRWKHHGFSRRWREELGL